MASLSTGVRVAGIACILGAASLTAFAAARPIHNDLTVNTPQLVAGKKAHLITSPNTVFDSQPGPNKWIRLCMEGQDCSSADDDIKRRSTFKA